METDLVIQTLNKVVHRASHGLILKTDQGSQYLSNAYEKRLNELVLDVKIILEKL
jgi:hypothetical protein